MTDKKTMWNEAGVAGLVLGGVSIAYMASGVLVGKMQTGVVSSLLSIVLWAAKFAGCIYLMKFFMKKFSESEPEADNSDTFRFGMMTALLSALLYAAFSMAYMQFINPDSVTEAFESVMDMYESMLDSNSLEQIENMIPKMPAISFFTNLVYCFLFGTVLSAIFSRNIPSKNPFEN